MSTAPPPPGRLVRAYDPAFRATMTVAESAVEDPAALTAAIAALPEPARALLDLLSLVATPGEPVPERLRERVAREGGPLWAAALLLPRASTWSEGSLHPQHYAGSCRLNPAVRTLGFSTAPAPLEAPPSFPPGEVRWDAVVVAAALEATPAALTQDGSLRRDVERRLYTQLGNDDHRWSLALRYARATGLVRAGNGKLHGFPEAHPRPLADVTSLLGGATEAAAAALVLRLVRAEWTRTDWLVDLLAGPGREVFYSPHHKRYPQRPELFDDHGFREVELPALLAALDVMHRAGAIDAVRDHEMVTAFRLPVPRPRPQGGFLLTPDAELLCHVAELRVEVYGRLARLAPYVDGDSLRRHRLSRDGIVAELGAGHRDTIDFLEEHSRTGVPHNVRDQVREWQRSATRLTVLTGVDVVEDADGRLRVATAADHGRIIDYTTRPRARFVVLHGKMMVPDGWDPLDLRVTLSRVGRPEGREGDAWVYTPTLRAHAQPQVLLTRLRDYHGGELPGEIEAMVLAGAGVQPATAVDAVLVRLPTEVADALRRDRVAGPLLRRQVGPGECVVPREQLGLLKERLAALGVGWAGTE